MARPNVERVASGMLAIILCGCTGAIGAGDRQREQGQEAVFGAAGAAGAAFGTGGAGAGGSGGGTAGTDPTTGMPLTCVTPEYGASGGPADDATFARSALRCTPTARRAAAATC